MKTRTIILVLAALVLVGVSCNRRLTDEEIQERKDKVDALFGEFEQSLLPIQDSLMALPTTMLQKSQAFNDIIKEKTPLYKERLLELLKENRSNEAGLYAYQMMSYFESDIEELAKMYNLLSKKVRESFEAFKDFTVNCQVATDEGTQEQELSFSDFVGKGKYVLVDFWASWCGPCKKELPNIAKVYEDFAGDDFDVLSVAVWDNPDDSFRAIDEHSMVWNQMIVSIDDNRIPADVYGFNGIPQIMLFGPDGKIIARDLRGDNIAKTIAKYVNKK